MARLNALPSTSFRRSRWKNGGGETIEIAAFPEGVGFDAFAWRISMAKVEASGPFSIFPGIDRMLCVLDGEGIELAFDGRARVQLDPASPPYSFPADIAVSGEVSGMGITDLNVMSRRGLARHHVSRMRLDGALHVAPLGQSLLVLSLEAGFSVMLGGTALALKAGDAALIENAEGTALDIKVEQPAEIFLIDLWS